MADLPAGLLNDILTEAVNTPAPSTQAVQAGMPHEVIPSAPSPVAIPTPSNMASMPGSKQQEVLASLVPQIMNALGGGDARTTQLLMQQQQQFKQEQQKKNLQGFMRTVTMRETGEITPELIMNQAEAWGVDPGQAMQAIGAFQQFRQKKRGSKQSYFQRMPEGGTRSIEAYADDPILEQQADQWVRGKYTADKGGMPFASSGQGIYDKRTGEITTPAAPKPMSPRDAAFSRLAPKDQRAVLLGQGKTQVNVNTGSAPAITTEANKVVGKKLGESVATRYQQADEAVKQNAQLNQVSTAIAQGADTGLGAELILDIKSFGQTLGLDTGDLSGQELIRKVSNEMALRLRNPESGMGLTGSTSNADLKFLKDSVVGLGRTEAGNQLIIESMKRYNQLKIDVAKEQDRLIRENGGNVPSNLNGELMRFVNSYDLFTPEERSAMEQATTVSSGEKQTTAASDMSDEDLMKSLGM
jgi:hypothetical protein